MYTLVSARYRKDRRLGRWVEADLSNVNISTLQSSYGDVWLLIAHPSFDDPKYLRVDQVAEMFHSTPTGLTVQEWLTSLGNITLPFTATPPEFKARYVQYAEAWHAGYSFDPVVRGGSYNPSGSRYDKADLIVSHESLSPTQIGGYAMFTVNGLFHMVDYSDQHFIIRDGNKSITRANDNQIGVYSFEDVGRITHIPIKANMVHGQGGDKPLRDGVYITLPDEVDVEGKTFLLVVGGYLQALDRTYSRVGDRTFKIQYNNLMLLERYYDSRDYIDLTSLGLAEYSGNDSLIETEAFQSDATLKAYLTLDQSFIVVVDSPTLFHELIPLDGTGLPNRYLDYELRHLPVVGAYGRMLECHRIQEDGTVVIVTTDNKRHNYSFYKHKWRDFPGVDASRLPHNPFREARAFLRMIGNER